MVSTAPKQATVPRTRHTKSLQNLNAGKLIRECQGGNAAAFDELNGRYTSLMLKIARSRASTLDMADDAVSNALLKIFGGIKTFKLGSPEADDQVNPAPWIARITINACYDLQRIAPREVSVDDALYALVCSSKLGDFRHIPGSDNHLERLEVQKRITHSDPDNIFTRASISAHYHGDSYEDIARKEEVSLGTTRSRIHRAVKPMRKLLAGIVDNG